MEPQNHGLNARGYCCIAAPRLKMANLQTRAEARDYVLDRKDRPLYLLGIPAVQCIFPPLTTLKTALDFATGYSGGGRSGQAPANPETAALLGKLMRQETPILNQVVASFLE